MMGYADFGTCICGMPVTGSAGLLCEACRQTRREMDALYAILNADSAAMADMGLDDDAPVEDGRAEGL